MRIQKLEICGFKSFKNKTVLEFKEGITGIVGPNGCGKSNIVDAFLWVMGETAPKHLRGSSFSDVIFSGTDTHPSGDLAEVSLVLEKGGEDFPEPHSRLSELMITRRAFRDGETEYLINKQPCRLKDIHEIFMNTGAGCRGFSIIEQEAVEKLITAKPRERRFIIEETAGITKFKARRDESIRKLDKVQQNLRRIEDILKQHDQHFQILNRQAKKTEKYRQIKETLRKQEIELSHRLYDDISEKQSELKTRALNRSEKQHQLKKNMEKTRELLKRGEMELQERESLQEKEKLYLSDLNCKIVEREKEIEKRNTATALHKNSLSRHSASQKNFQEEADHRRKRIEEIESQQKSLRADENILRKHIRDLESFLAGEKNLEESPLELQIQKDREAFHEISVRKTLIDSQRTTLAKTREEISEKKSLLEKQLRQIFKEKSKRSLTLEKSRQMKLDFSKSAEERDRDIKTLTEETRRAEKKANRLKQEIAVLSHKADNLNQLIQKYEGMERGAKDLKSWKPDQFKPLITSLKVEPGFETAAQAALGLFLKSFLTPDTYFIERGISRLKENKKGRCVFVSSLPLKTEDPPETKQLKKYPAFICFLNEKIQFTLEMGPLNTLSRQTAVVSNLSSAFELKSRFPSLQFVTKEGDLITKESFVCGGSRDGEIGELQIRGEKALLEEAIKSKETELSPEESALQKKTLRLEELIKERDKTFSRKGQADVFIAEHKKDLERLEKEIFRLTEEQSALLSREQEIAKENERLQRETEGVRKEESRFNRMIKTKETALDQIRKSKMEYRMSGEKLSKTKMNLTENLNRQNIHENEKTLLAGLINQSREREREFAGNRLSIQRIIQDEEQKILEISKELTLFREEKNQVTTQIEKLRASQEQRKANEQKIRERLEIFSDELSHLEKEEISLQSEKEKADIQKQNIKEKLFENHQFTLGEDSFIPEWEETPTDGLKLSIEKLTKEIESAGAVNLVALKERDELMEKINFLTTQKDDLIQSKSDLLKVISHIDGICDTRFKTMLKEINQRFERVFPLIFEGENSSARLILLEDPEKGETGVDIEVRPPGKKPQSVTLLSRGEKALTSLCLVYSLFLVKPSPFCVLDEIDAPLDDANVFRFISVMREMAKKSQIIAITHNKHTMQFCSGLYGVTMQEKGVSQIVSVQLEKTAPETSPSP